MKMIMRKMSALLLVCSLCLTVMAAKDWTVDIELAEGLRKGKFTERFKNQLPDLIKEGVLTKEVICKIVKAAIKRNPKRVVAIVKLAVQGCPEYAALITKAAVEVAPKQAAAINKTAAEVAAKQVAVAKQAAAAAAAAAITKAAVEAAPKD